MPCEATEPMAHTPDVSTARRRQLLRLPCVKSTLLLIGLMALLSALAWAQSGTSELDSYSQAVKHEGISNRVAALEHSAAGLGIDFPM